MDSLRRIFDDPVKCLRLGIVSSVIGLSFIAIGLFGPGKFTYLRFVSVVFFVASYFLYRNYFRSRAAARRNQSQQQGEQAVQFQQPVANDQTQPPAYPTGGTYGFTGMQNQPNGESNTPTTTANDPSLPPPYPTFTWPGGQQTNNPGDMPPPPSYDEVMRGNR